MRRSITLSGFFNWLAKQSRFLFFYVCISLIVCICRNNMFQHFSFFTIDPPHLLWHTILIKTSYTLFNNNITKWSLHLWPSSVISPVLISVTLLQANSLDCIIFRYKIIISHKIASTKCSRYIGTSERGC